MMQLKSSCIDGTFKKSIQAKVTATKAATTAKAKQVFMKVTKKLAPQVTALSQTSVFKKVVQMAVSGSEKALGKEKTTTILSTAETYIPTAWKPAPPPSKKSN